MMIENIGIEVSTKRLRDEIIKVEVRLGLK